MERLREHLRVSRHLVVDFTPFGHKVEEETWLKGEVENLGGGGVKMRLGFELASGTTLKMAIHLDSHHIDGDRLVSGAETGLLTVLGQVVWVKRRSDSVFEAGIRFVGRILDGPPGEEEADDR